MTKPLGKTQLAVLDEVQRAGRISVKQIAERLGQHVSGVRRAAYTLADRELVVLSREPGGWSGKGVYGNTLRGMPVGIALYVMTPGWAKETARRAGRS